MSSRRGKAAEPKPAGTVRPGRRERRRVETRERIFRAALALFAERGFTGTTVEDITEAADVGKGTFFNYFPSKEHVLAAFGAMQVDKIAAFAADPALAQTRPRDLLRRMVRALAEEPGRSPALVRALLTGILTSGAVRELMLANLGRARKLLRALFDRAQVRGVVRSDLDSQMLARAMTQMFFGTMFLWALDPSEKLAARFDRSFELFWAGVAAKE